MHLGLLGEVNDEGGGGRKWRIGEGWKGQKTKDSESQTGTDSGWSNR